MHSGSWRTRLLNPAVVAGGGRRQACVFWALLLLHAATAELDALAVCKVKPSEVVGRLGKTSPSAGIKDTTEVRPRD